MWRLLVSFLTVLIKNVLLKNGFRFIEIFTLDDIYMYNKKGNKFFIKYGKISDTLIVRKAELFYNKNCLEK